MNARSLGGAGSVEVQVDRVVDVCAIESWSLLGHDDHLVSLQARSWQSCLGSSMFSKQRGIFKSWLHPRLSPH